MKKFAAVPAIDHTLNHTSASARHNEDQHDEAQHWLTNNRNLHCFASNRFGHKEKALDFVKQLYRTGAVRVEVTQIYDEAWRIAEEGGPYADTLLVHLPSDELLAPLTILCLDADEFFVRGNIARLWWD